MKKEVDGEVISNEVDQTIGEKKKKKKRKSDIPTSACDSTSILDKKRRKEIAKDISDTHLGDEFIKDKGGGEKKRHKKSKDIIIVEEKNDSHSGDDIDMSSKKKDKKKNKSKLSKDMEVDPVDSLGKKKKKKRSTDQSCDSGNDTVFKSDDGITDTSAAKPSKKEKKRKKEKSVDSGVEENASDADVDPKTSGTTAGKKKKKKKESKAIDSKDEDKGSRTDRAVEYVRKWHTDRSNWKFEKVKQMVLFSCMYSEEKIPADDFEILLLYLEGLVGKARQKTLDDAEKKLSVLDEAESKSEEQSKEYERIRSVIQVLS